MDATIARALEPSTPGWLVRSLAPILPGIATTRDQIGAHHEFWQARVERALAVNGVAAGPVVVALGDSLSQGIGASSTDRLWPDQLAERIAGVDGRYEIVNFSRSGARIDDVIEIQLPALRAIHRSLDYVTCTVGSNDLVRGASIRKAAGSLRSLMARLPPGAVLATLPANGSIQAKRLNRVIRREAADHGLVVADVDRHLTTWRGRSAGDRFHPNDAGYEAWIDAFAEALAGAASPAVTAEPETVER